MNYIDLKVQLRVIMGFLKNTCLDNLVGVVLACQYRLDYFTNLKNSIVTMTKSFESQCRQSLKIIDNFKFRKINRVLSSVENK